MTWAGTFKLAIKVVLSLFSKGSLTWLFNTSQVKTKKRIPGELVPNHPGSSFSELMNFISSLKRNVVTLNGA
jgi:hypothetical protein